MKAKARAIYDWMRGGAEVRNWTYSMRDSAHESPFYWMLMSAVVVSVVANALPWWAELAAWGAMLLGLLLGHLFWGTPWKKGERRDIKPKHEHSWRGYRFHTTANDAVPCDYPKGWHMHQAGERWCECGEHEEITVADGDLCGQPYRLPPLSAGDVQRRLEATFAGG